MHIDSLAQMALPLSDSPHDPGQWVKILADAFADPKRTSGFLPLAEQAVRAHPGDHLILCFAATAALFDERPVQALVFLKRYYKRYVPGAIYHLLHALALAQQKKFYPAYALLERHELTSIFRAAPAFPGAPARNEWLSEQLGRILAARKRATSGIGRNASGGAAKTRPVERPNASVPSAPVAAKVPAAPPGLPRIDIEFRLRPNSILCR